MTVGWDETEVLMDVSPRRLAPVQYRHLPARGLLSLFSLLSAFLLTVIKRNQVPRHDLVVLGGLSAPRAHSPQKKRPGVVLHDPNPTRMSLLHQNLRQIALRHCALHAQ